MVVRLSCFLRNATETGLEPKLDLNRNWTGTETGLEPKHKIELVVTLVKQNRKLKQIAQHLY